MVDSPMTNALPKLGEAAQTQCRAFRVDRIIVFLGFRDFNSRQERGSSLSCTGSGCASWVGTEMGFYDVGWYSEYST